jgi:hypothetical protein
MPEMTRAYANVNRLYFFRQGLAPFFGGIIEGHVTGLLSVMLLGQLKMKRQGLNNILEHFF